MAAILEAMRIDNNCPALFVNAFRLEVGPFCRKGLRGKANRSRANVESPSPLRPSFNLA